MTSCHRFPTVTAAQLTGSCASLCCSNGFSLVTASKKAHQLEDLLHRKILASQVIMASSPMRELAQEHANDRILVVADSPAFVRKIASHYGFNNIVAVEDYVAAHHVLYPAKKHEASPQKPWEEEEPIKAVFLLETPGLFPFVPTLEDHRLTHCLTADDWGLSLQVCLDVLRSDGVPGIDHASDSQVVKLYSGNPDLDYGAVHSLPRITLGAFRRCLETLFHDTTGRHLHAEFFGKPYPKIVSRICFLFVGFFLGFLKYLCCQYHYAERELQKYTTAPIQRYYAIGDNPRSDVRGANQAGKEWYSILVRSGCFKGPGNDPVDPARFVCDTVKEAVQHIFELEGLHGHAHS